MSLFSVEFIDGTAITVEADVYELHDQEWLFRRAEKIVAHYAVHQVRGVQELPPDAFASSGGGSY